MQEKIKELLMGALKMTSAVFSPSP